MSPSDFKTQKMNRNEARKLISELAKSQRVHILKHAFERMEERNVSTQDALNVLESPSSIIEKDGELEKGSYRYRLSTRKIILVVSFKSDGSLVYILTVMRKL